MDSIGDWDRVISHQLIQAMQPTLSDFYEIWYACRTSFPDFKHTDFFKIGEVEPKLWVFNTFTPRIIQVVRKKTAGSHMALRGNLSGPVNTTDPVEKLYKSCSLHSKKFFWLGGAGFCEWRCKWMTFRPPWPTSPGPGHKLLDGTISLKFLLETGLQSKSFDTLDDLLRFLVLK